MDKEEIKNEARAMNGTSQFNSFVYLCEAKKVLRDLSLWLSVSRYATQLRLLAPWSSAESFL
jgi:hypothetical protein